ncbi:MAG: SDR family oxidoreductase [Candidatus Rokubacteria bacterium]|nr:SDR family oxidoreductase [Candidatus Rokubacteria bacterium]
MLTSRTPLGRMGTTADVGNAVVLFCSEGAGWITGPVVYVDGGASLMDTLFPLDIQCG